jgi:4-alpha-glucanotransferase
MITDLFGSDQRFNVPGAVAESNWSQRLPHEIEKWRTCPALRPLSESLKSILQETGRL